MQSMNQELVVIREAASADAAGIARVHINSWQSTYRGIVPEAYLGSLDYSERTVRWKSLLSEPGSANAIYVAEAQQEGVVGFASGGPERSGDPIYRGELYAIYVLPEYQRIGLGIRLAEAIVDPLVRAGLDSMMVWVLADNQPARRFYQRLGGKLLRTQTIEIGGIGLEEVAYGWEDIGILKRHLIG